MVITTESTMSFRSIYVALELSSSSCAFSTSGSLVLAADYISKRPRGREADRQGSKTCCAFNREISNCNSCSLSYSTSMRCSSSERGRSSSSGIVALAFCLSALVSMAELALTSVEPMSSSLSRSVTLWHTQTANLVLAPSHLTRLRTRLLLWSCVAD